MKTFSDFKSIDEAKYGDDPSKPIIGEEIPLADGTYIVTQVKLIDLRDFTESHLKGEKVSDNLLFKAHSIRMAYWVVEVTPKDK